jgi:hypothetical protein
MHMTGHKLEALDPKHRDYNKLHEWFGHWTGQDWPGETLDDFFKWLDAYEVPEEGAELPRTRYITSEDQRKKYKLGFPGGLPFYTERKNFYRAQSYNVKLSIPERRKAEDKAKRADKPLQAGIYVMTPDKEFYARREDPVRKVTFHHSSFLAGLPVAAAGHMNTVGGLKIDLESGHYAPRTLHMLNAVNALKGKGLALDKLKVGPIPSEYWKSSFEMGAKDFIGELKALKKSNGQKGGRMKMIANRVPIVKQQLTEAYKAV